MKYFLSISIIINIMLIIYIGIMNTKESGCSYDSIFDNGFYEALNDYNIDEKEVALDNNDLFLEKEVISVQGKIDYEKVYMSGYIAAVKSLGLDAKLMDINFNYNEIDYCN